jgi:hypothetical protein
MEPSVYPGRSRRSDFRVPLSLQSDELRTAPVQRVSWTFTPEGFQQSYDYAFPVPLTVVRRS